MSCLQQAFFWYRLQLQQLQIKSKLTKAKIPLSIIPLNSNTSHYVILASTKTHNQTAIRQMNIHPRTPANNLPTFNQKQTMDQRQQEQQLALLQRVVRKFYFFHLVLIALVYIYLIFGQPNFKMSFTFVLLTIYCSMIVWNWLVNFALVILGFDNVAVVFNRVLIRFAIILFSPLGLAAILLDNYLGSTVVLILIFYMALISFLFLLYQIYGCTIGEPRNPKYIFQPIDLHAQTQKIWEIRKQYNKEILSQRNSLMAE